MQKKGYLLLGISTCIFLLAFYGQIILLNNDVTMFVQRAKYEQSPIVLPIIPVEVKTDTTIYLNYRATADRDVSFSIIDGEDHVIFQEEGREILIQDKKMKLPQGSYRFRVEAGDSEVIEYKYGVIHRTEEVFIDKD